MPRCRLRRLAPDDEPLAGSFGYSAGPLAVVEQGTTSQQRVITGALSNIIQKVKKEKLKSPSLIIIGNVVKLRKKLNWFN